MSRLLQAPHPQRSDNRARASPVNLAPSNHAPVSPGRQASTRQALAAGNPLHDAASMFGLAPCAMAKDGAHTSQLNPCVAGAAQHEALEGAYARLRGLCGVMRCRPGTVTIRDDILAKMPGRRHIHGGTGCALRSWRRVRLA